MADQQLKKKAGPKKKAKDEFNEDEIFQAPVITRDPMSRQAKIGSKVVLRVTAEARPLPSYQWFHNGKKIVGAVTDRLTLSKLRRLNGGAYHCEVKNFVGKATSRVAMLSFFTQKVPQLVIEPELSKVEEGKPFSIKVVSPSAKELKDFQIHWIFNGMRIKGAHGIELNISAMKKKYEGEFKAMIATGGSLETSNVAKLVMKPARVKTAAKAQEPEPVSEPEPEPSTELPAPPPKKAENWEDFLFNPESEDEEPSLVAPAPGSDTFGNTSPGTPGSPKAPLSQLATQDLIREVAAQGGASELIGEVKNESSGLIPSPPPEPAVEREDPSGLIEALERREEPAPVAEKEDSSQLIESATGKTPYAFAEREDPSKLIEMLEASREVPAPAASPIAPAVEKEDPSQLIEMLEKGTTASAPVAEDPSGLIESLEKREPVAVTPPPVAVAAVAAPKPPAPKLAVVAPPPPAPAANAEEDTDDLIQDWGIAPKAAKPAEPEPPGMDAVPVPIRPSPKLVRRKEFLEELLQRWQARSGKKNDRRAA